ncbi:MAG TPA: transglutaminase domain-containing protein, partial [Polyangiaceae bacterium]|nr:transglutaminase domain-containing protein [Polyangiaceae bacterium]
ALSSLDRARYTALPPSITPRVAALAARWSAAATSPLERAKAIEAELRRAYRYDLESPSGLAENPLDHFLFESRRGHCEFYSTAMAILLRTVGVPTRNVTGFASGTYNRFGGFYAVRQGDAHSWVEVFIDGSGWIRFDPTPTAAAEPRSELAGAFAVLRELVEAAAQGWNRHVQDYDLDQQLGLLRGVRQGLAGTRHAVQPLFSPRRVVLLILGAALLLLSLWTLRRTGALPARPGERPSPTPPATLRAVALYRALEAALAASGVPRQASTPPLAHARALLALGHPSAPEILDLTSLYLEARFGGRPLDDAQRRAFLRRVKLLRQAHDLRSPAAA